jgi:hypothetical protein
MTEKRLKKITKTVKKLRSERETDFALTQVTPTHKLIVVKSEQRIRRVQKLGMEHDFHAIIHAIEEIAAANADWRKRRRKQNYASRSGR